jgi:hypothetical protein
MDADAFGNELDGVEAGISSSAHEVKVTGTRDPKSIRECASTEPGFAA